MFIPLAVIAAIFLAIWVFAVAIEFQIRPKEKVKSTIVSPKSSLSLVSLLLFLFAPTRFTNLSQALKCESDFHPEADSR